MARSIVLNRNGEVSTFGFTKVEREKLYGRKVKMIVDEEGNRCVAAHLTSDGTALVPPGGTAYLYLDEQRSTVERSELQATDLEGQPLPILPSTLGREVPLEGPVPAQRLLDHLTVSVYELAPEDLGAGLQQELTEGKILETRFSYRDDHNDSPAFLLKNDQGIFLLISQATGFEFLGREVLLLPEEDTEDVLGDELDFGMM